MTNSGGESRWPKLNPSSGWSKSEWVLPAQWVIASSSHLPPNEHPLFPLSDDSSNSYNFHLSQRSRSLSSSFQSLGAFRREARQKPPAAPQLVKDGQKLTPVALTPPPPFGLSTAARSSSMTPVGVRLLRAVVIGVVLLTSLAQVSTPVFNILLGVEVSSDYDNKSHSAALVKGMRSWCRPK